MSKKVLLFGTNNLHKLREIRELVGHRYDIKSLSDLGLDMDVEETEPTLEGNAILKAKAFFERTGMPCFSDDTGLSVAALNGAPGVRTARYAGEACKPEDNIRKMLAEMEGKEDRSAVFETVIAYYDGMSTRTFVGSVQGDITEKVKGAGGFGYDPIFQPEGYTKTFAQLTPAVKNRISHRGRAIQKFVEFLT